MSERDAEVRVPPAPDRPTGAHKGTFGTVIVLGGSAAMIGAPAMAATAAFRGGAGLVKAAVPAAILPFVLSIEPGATGVPLDASAPASLAALDDADPQRRAVLAVGPGLGRSPWAAEMVALVLRGRRATVLDADGLNLLAETARPRPRPDPPLVMTPHPGEFARLAQPLGVTESPTDPSTRPAAARKLAAAHRAVVVLKGERSVISDGRRVYTNTTGNPALATAGSGDVLTGLIAALLAQGMSPLNAAVLGVYLHGLAGDLWMRRRGPSGLLARDLADLLIDAFQHHRALPLSP